jgi:hypothetical protein
LAAARQRQANDGPALLLNPVFARLGGARELDGRHLQLWLTERS